MASESPAASRHKEVQERFTALGENASDLIWELDEALEFIYVSPNFREILHYKPAGLLGRKMVDFLHPEDIQAVSGQLGKLIVNPGPNRLLFRIRNARGEWRWLDCSGKAYCAANGKIRAVFISRDVTERQQLEEQRALLASRDPTTVLYNKQYFVEQLIKAIDNTRHGIFCAVIYIDLDNFKLINDRCGHLAGDRLIVAIANLLHEATPENGLLARFGGDEFLLLLNDVNKIDEAAAVAEEIRLRLTSYHFIDGGNGYVVSASLGVVRVDGSANSREVLNRANAASASAKALGGNRVELFEQVRSGQEGFRDCARWSQRILDGLRDGHFELCYQPVVRTATGVIDHYEALLRLCDKAGVHSPSLFLPSADRFGYMEMVDRYVAESAVGCLARRPERRVAIILSGQSFSKPDMTALILDALRQAGVDASRLIVQVPWAALLATPMRGRVKEGFTALKAAGVPVGIKNFRGDFSSLQYLRDLPVDYLKLDGELMRDFATSALRQATVSAVHEIGHALNALTIADFVDDKPTLDRLREIGIDFAKGDYLGRALREDRSETS